jgi:hypothetical protein
MNNLERVTAVLERHREARQWTDGGAAGEVLAALNIDPTGTAPPSDLYPDAVPHAALAAERDAEMTRHAAAMAEIDAKVAVPVVPMPAEVIPPPPSAYHDRELPTQPVYFTGQTAEQVAAEQKAREEEAARVKASEVAAMHVP